MDGFEAWHILEGEPIGPLRQAKLSDNPALWGELWEQFRDEILPGRIELTPGQRAEAWHQFDSPSQPARAEGESEVEWLFRCGLIGPDELEAIRSKAMTLAEHNRTRRPDRPGDNYLSPTALEYFAVNHGLVTNGEAEVLTRLETIGWGWKKKPEADKGAALLTSDD